MMTSDSPAAGATQASPLHIGAVREVVKNSNRPKERQ